MTTPDVPYRFELTLEVPGTPDQVWHAIASAEGISAWMMPTELEAREDGAVTFSMGPGEASHGRITAWEPTHRLAYEEDWASLVDQAGAPVTPLVSEFLVEARSGTCVVRVVSSAFGTGADWENEFWEEMTRGWAPVLDNLRLYLTHFPGQRATPLWASATFAIPPQDATALVRRDLGVGEVGEEISARGITGHVERVIDRHFLLRLSQPVPGFLSFFSFAGGDGTSVSVQGYLFSDDAAAYVEREQSAWTEWLEGIAAGVTANR